MTTARVMRSVDGRGRTITTFVVFEIAQQLDSLSEGDVVEVLTDEFEPFASDIEAWCAATGHTLALSESVADGRRFLIEKSTPIVKGTSLAMVISDAGLSELLSPLGFALAAALEGTDVHLYFQGPAVKVLTRGYQPKLHGWARPFSRFAAAAMNRSGHIPAQEKLHQLRSLGGRIYVCGGSLQPFKVRPEDLMFDDLPIIEYLSFVPILEDASVQMYV